MIEKLQAVGEFIFILRDSPEETKFGLKMPEPSLKKPNTGKILSVGELVQDKNVQAGKTAVFVKQVGSEINIFDTDITVLNGNNQLLGVL